MSEIVNLLAVNGNVVEDNRAISYASNELSRCRMWQAFARSRRVPNPHVTLNNPAAVKNDDKMQIHGAFDADRGGGDHPAAEGLGGGVGPGFHGVGVDRRGVGIR